MPAPISPKVAELWRRHAMHYAALLIDLNQRYDRKSGTSSGVAEVVAAFDLEWAQLHLAQTRVATHREVDPDGALAFSFFSNGLTLSRLRRPSQELGVGLDRALEFAATHDAEIHADVTMSAGAIADEMDDLYRAQQYFTAGIRIVREASDIPTHNADVLLSKGLRFLGIIEHRLGGSALARTHLDEALTIAHRAGLDDEVGQVTGNLAIVVSESGDDTAAVPLYERAIEHARRQGDLAHVQIWTGDLANALHNLGRIDQAAAAVAESLDLARRLGDRRAEGTALGILAGIELTRCHAAQAMAYQRAGLQIATEFDDRFSQGVSLNRLGRIYETLGQPDEAEDALRQAADHLTAANRPELATQAKISADNVARAAERHRLVTTAHAAVRKADEDRFDEAVSELTVLIAVSQAADDEALTSLCMGHLAYVRMQQRHYALAEALVREALTLDEPGSDLHVNHVLTLANIRQLSGDEPAATALYAAFLARHPPGSGHDRARGIALANLAMMSNGTTTQQHDLNTAALAAFRAAGAPEAGTLGQLLGVTTKYDSPVRSADVAHR